jgi:dinuclear metal center YbgI/SA1388 family protein
MSDLPTVGEIYQFINDFAPFDTAMDFDNCGLLAGSEKTEVKTVLLALDITPDVVYEAATYSAQLIVSHHPVIFNPLRTLREGTAPYLLARYGIAAVCAHTNLDLSPKGVNASLAAKLGLKNVRMMKEYQHSGLAEALAGETEREYEPKEFAESVKNLLGCDGLFYTDGKRKITLAGLCSGAGSDCLYSAARYGCQAFVTGEAKHHQLIDAENLGVTLVVAGHYYTENVVIQPLMERLQAKFPSAGFIRSRVSHCPAKYL